ncbi:transposase [Nitrospira sp. Nam74]
MILDNLSTHKTKQVQRFLSDHPTVQLHFTPAYYPCLNQVEFWITKIKRDVLAREIFTSWNDLKQEATRVFD